MVNHNLNNLLRWLVLLFFNITIAGSLFIPLLQFTRNREQLLILHRQEIENQISTILGLYEKMSESLFQLNVDTAEVVTLLEAAYATDNPEEKDQAREELLHLLGPFYHTIQSYHFRQLHFHEKDNTSFLRFHRPDRYGDDLTDIRYSVDYVNRYHRPIKGFEEGRIYNGYRFVYPMFNDLEYLGSVEVSISMKTLVEQLESYYGTEVLFLLSRKTMEEKVFDQEWENYIPWTTDDDFVINKEVNDHFLLEIPEGINAQEKNRQTISDKMASQHPFSFILSVGDERRIAGLLPIENIEGDLVAWLFTLGEFLPLKQLYRRTLIFFLLVLTILILFLFFSFYFLKSRKKLETMATKDSLTGVYTRRMLFQLLQEEDENFKRYGTPYTLIMVDIDHFKKVNDNFGHQMGDKVLTEMTGLLKMNIRKSDIIGRYGGEEFLIILTHLSIDDARIVGEKIRKKVEYYDFPTGESITISCGMAERQAGGEDYTGLIKLADERLYDAKRKGRNRLVSE